MKTFFRGHISSAALVAATIASANIYSNKSADTRLPALNPTAVTDSGILAPLGGFWSELENDLGNTLESNGNSGFNILPQTATPEEYFRVSDDFVVEGGRITITGVQAYAYNSGLQSATSPFLDGSCKILSSAPHGTANILGSSIAFSQSFAVPVAANGAEIITAELYRCFNTQYPDPGTAPSLWRKIQQLNFTLASPVELGPGTYWVDYSAIQGFGLSGFVPCTTHEESRLPPGEANGLYKQFQGIGTGWEYISDAGSPPSSAPDVIQELPFILVGHVVRYASSIDVQEGVLFGGTPASLLATDNNRVYVLCDESTPNSELRIGFNTSISYTSSMEVSLESGSDRDDQVQFFSIYNPSTQDWTPIGSASTSTSETLFEAPISEAHLYTSASGDVVFRAVVIPSTDLEAADGWSNFYNRFSMKCTP